MTVAQCSPIVTISKCLRPPLTSNDLAIERDYRASSMSPVPAHYRSLMIGRSRQTCVFHQAFEKETKDLALNSVSSGSSVIQNTKKILTSRE